MAGTVSEERVAITGVAISCALGNGSEEVWKAVRDGECGIRLTQRLDVSKLSCHYSGEIDTIEQPAHEPQGRLDRATRLALSASRDAIASAALRVADHDPYRVGVALGTSVGGLDEGEQFHWELLRGGVEATRAEHLLIYPLYTAADAVSVAFQLKGPKVVVSNACAAGANAIGYAVDAIRNGRADVMVAGGVDVLDILSLAGFDSLKALDDKPCAPYSRSTGLNLGEGVAILILEAESVAAARQAPVLAYVHGCALTSDAHHATAPDPAGSGARRAMSRALEQAGLVPSQVDYVNGHGTGTPANDSAEMKAFDALFADCDPVPVSSTKSQVGHMLGAAGAIEAAICALALRDQVIPPTVNVADPEAVGRDVVANRSRPHALDVVVSNSFAFGGNNCSLVLGRGPGKPRPRTNHRVVVTGAGVVSAIGIGRQAFLDAVRAGTSGLGAARSLDTSQCGSDLVAEIADVAGLRRHVDPAYVRRLDQLGLYVLASTRMALQDAGHRVTLANAERIGMVFGTYTGPLETVSQLTETIGTDGPDRVNPRLFPNSVMNAAAGHACLSLQLKGPLSTLATGCASGVTALGYATDLIASGEADVMLAVSADELTPLLQFGYDRLGILTSEALRPYDDDRDGCVLGAGGVTLVLESEEHALERGATILGEVRGHAITSDAYRIAGNDRTGTAWAESFRRAIHDAGLTPDDVGTVYGDARGTFAVDIAEARAISQVWEPSRVAVANLTGYVGHVHSTTPLMAAVCALETGTTGWVPPILGLRTPVAELAPFVAATPAGSIGRASVVTAANWGGTYATAVLAPWAETVTP